MHVYFVLCSAALCGHSLFSSVDAAYGGAQGGKWWQSGLIRGQHVTPFARQEVDLSPEGFSLLRLFYHQVLEILDSLLVCASPVVLELLSALDTFTHI